MTQPNCSLYNVEAKGVLYAAEQMLRTHKSQQSTCGYNREIFFTNKTPHISIMVR